MAQTENGLYLEWGKHSERVERAELAGLTEIVNEQANLSDYWIARAIYDLSRPSDDRKWREVTGFTAMFRVGYILGVRRERARRRAATHAHTAAAFTSLELPRLEGLPHEFR